VVPRKPGTVLLDEAVLVLADDIGHLEGGPVHRFCNFRESLMLSGLETSVSQHELTVGPPAPNCNIRKKIKHLWAMI